MAEEFWRWTESRWTNPDIDWKKGSIISAGVDVGSVSSQAVVMVDGELFCYGNTRTGSNSPDSAIKCMTMALEDTGLTIDDLQYTIGTGYGRVNVPFGQRAITEIACHGRGANFMYGPTIRTVLDMGGQDCKAIHVDERGKVTNFLMNDKCAAGTGRGMEVFADLLGVSINDVGDMSLQVDEEPEPVSSTCVVFAKSEASGLLRAGWPKEKVLAAYSSAMAHRVVGLLERIGVEPDFGITGGIAKNKGVVNRMAEELKITPLKSKYDSQIAGALGAALFGEALIKKGKKK
ncbi:MAG: benzoyl-CoA reductase, bzd-type, subunit Q [Deltaproteobacteria bacterium]|nr:benzoyl-CoA reductase, bzd-type, subunit Q [Deltaproteobacteria bacterium]